MKRFSLLFIAIILFGSLAGCNSKPSNISEQHYSYGKKAIEIADKYIDYEINAEEAYKQIQELESRSEELPETKTGDSDHVYNFAIEIEVSSLSSRLLNAKWHPSQDNFQSIVEARNKIAQHVGVSQRKG